MSKVFKGAGILAIFSLAAKMIGALYRIPLTNIVGAEGMGLYQMVFPLYTVLLTVSSGGIPVAISRVVACRLANDDSKGAKQVLRVSLISLSLAGLIGSLLIVFFRFQIAGVQGNRDAALPYLGIAPSVLFVAIISSFRGYYQGHQNMLPSAISQITEQLIKMGAGLLFARLLVGYSVGMAVFGALVGVSLSELVTLLVLWAQYFITELKHKKRTRVSIGELGFEAAADAGLSGGDTVFPVYTSRQVLKEIYKIAIPVTLGSLVMPLTQVIDSALVINILVNGGYARNIATSLFGLCTGTINSLINMPTVISLSFSAALMPRVSEAKEKGEDCSATIAKCLRFNVYIGVLGSLVLTVFSEPLLRLLYSRGLSAEQLSIGANLLKTGGISVLYVSLLQVATAVLQGQGYAAKPAVNLLFGAIVKVAATLLLLPLIGIEGAMAGTVLCYMLTCFLDTAASTKKVPVRLYFKNFILAPLIGAAAFTVSGLLLVPLLTRLTGGFFAVIIALTVSLALFLTAVIALKGIVKQDLYDVPLVGKMLRKRAGIKAMKALEKCPENGETDNGGDIF